MIYGSVCSGIEAATVAWKPLGWRCAFVSEIDKFPSAVLAHHYPDVPNYGDVTKFKEWPDAAIDLLVGGTPCQSFSVAGLRGGLDDPRGNLTLTYLAVVARYRPRWLVWENVPGVLSIDGGWPFGTFLGGLAELGYGFAYRVLDAQYVRVESHPRAVPQRRRRVFVVGHFGDWRRAAAVLFERESLRRNPAPRREAGEGVTGTLSTRTEGGGGLGTDFECHGGLVPEVSLCLNAGAMGRRDSETETETMLPVARSLRADGFYASELGAKDNGMAIAIQNATRGKDQNGLGIADQDDPMFTLDQGSQHAVAIAGGQVAVATPMMVRRLTPRECERLMGFPDNYTLIPYRNKPAADGPRYKALGNSMAVNVMRWIGDRISAVENIEERTHGRA